MLPVQQHLPPDHTMGEPGGMCSWQTMLQCVTAIMQQSNLANLLSSNARACICPGPDSVMDVLLIMQTESVKFLTAGKPPTSEKGKCDSLEHSASICLNAKSKS